MAIDSRGPTAGTLIHSDQGVQSHPGPSRGRAAGSVLALSKGGVGDCYDNSMTESFRSHMEVELLDWQRWRIRVEPANATFAYPEIWHNRRRRSRLGMLTLMELERRQTITPA